MVRFGLVQAPIDTWGSRDGENMKSHRRMVKLAMCLPVLMLLESFTAPFRVHLDLQCYENGAKESIQSFYDVSA